MPMNCSSPASTMPTQDQRRGGQADPPLLSTELYTRVEGLLSPTQRTVSECNRCSTRLMTEEMKECPTPRGMESSFIYFFKSSPKDIFFPLLLERERRGKGEREKHRLLPPVCTQIICAQDRDWTATYVRALTGNLPCNISVTGQCPNKLSYISQGEGQTVQAADVPRKAPPHCQGLLSREVKAGILRLLFKEGTLC